MVLGACGCALLIAALLTRIARAKSVTSLQRLIRTDQRSPILFLRSFSDDAVPVRVPWLWPLQWLATRGRALRSIDEILLEEGTVHGPVIALGRPGQSVPPYGAARGHFADVDWQRAVKDLSQSSLCIVLCVGGSAGVAWEIAEIGKEEFADKLLVLFPPEAEKKARNFALLDVIATGLPAFAAPIEAAKAQLRPSEKVIGLFSEYGTLRILTARKFRSYHYITALRQFMTAKPLFSRAVA
jgi:hypothetical protein